MHELVALENYPNKEINLLFVVHRRFGIYLMRSTQRYKPNSELLRVQS